MKKLMTLGATLCVAGLMVGCGGVSGEGAASAPAGDNRPAASQTAEASQQETAVEETTAAEESPAKEGDAVQTFGAAYTWEDGLSVTIGKPQPFKPSEWAAGQEGFKNFVVFDVTVVNKTGKPWDPAMFHVTVQSANQEASEIFDSQNLKDRPSTKLLNGREVAFKIAFGVQDPKDLVMEVTPDFEHESAMFQA